ncbi:MAG: ISKra4 family transposase [Bryobacterales bacterium]|nr:ISKra4 family transposase [Bryobacterales bacterium]
MSVAAQERHQRRKKKACAEEFAPALEAEVDRFLAPGATDGIDLEAFELHMRRQALRLAALAVERRLNADLSDGEPRPHECSCGRQARYAGRFPKTFETALGPLTLERAYYHCQRCGKGFCPRDAALDLHGTSLSPAVTRMTGSAAALASFRRASELLAELGGVTVRAKRVERVAEALGREIAAAESAAVFDCEPPSAPTMYLGIDGTGVPMRPKELAGRAGKQADGSAGTREVKVIVIWTAEQCDDDGNAVCDTGSTTYSAAIDSAASRDTDPEQSAFARRVWREAARRGFPQAARRVILGDGAKWIWRVACELFPGAIQIVDFYHAAERLWEVAKDLLRDDRAAAETWAEARCSELREGRLDSLLATLQAHAGQSKKAAECHGYVETNRDRMRYADFRAQGLQIGSGVVEAGCKTVVGVRLKQAGMHWTKDGAEGILALRACILGGRYEDFWAWRSESQHAAAA